MDPYTLGLAGFGSLLVLIAIGVPIAFAMSAVGVGGLFFLTNFTQTASQVGLNAWEKGADFVMVALPLFILMGQLVFHLKIAEDLYEAVQKWFGRLPGGLAITAVVASAGFGAVTGVSAASVATMGAMTMPEMRRYRYDPGLATGSLAISGTLAILIPPSVLMVVYGIWTETSIGALFIAGIIPGLLLTTIFAVYIFVRCRLNPQLGPMGEKHSPGEKLRSTKSILPILGDDLSRRRPIRGVGARFRAADNCPARARPLAANCRGCLVAFTLTGTPLFVPIGPDANRWGS